MILNCLLISRTRHLYKIGFRSISTSEKKGILGFKTDQTLKKYLNSITFNGRFTSLLIWGGTAALGTLLFSQGIPRVRNQIHQASFQYFFTFFAHFFSNYLSLDHLLIQKLILLTHNFDYTSSFFSTILFIQPLTLANFEQTSTI
ncbi:unnamed protein product [Pneumocystis jirovecii]|uniref:Uncharacterized protein n=1 Tax=Pneumocystis jirovecii TaxID=42068 RepID=L0PHS1_PNEJI|nr:unnamed protein product [Pneumocystis jirovecii]